MTQPPQQIACPKCKAYIPAKAKFCNRCGTKIAPPVQVKSEKPPLTHRPDMTFGEFFEFAGQSALQQLNSGQLNPHFILHDQAGKSYLILLTGTKDNMRNVIVMGLMKMPWKYFVLVLEASARGTMSVTGASAAGSPVQAGMGLLMIEGISRGGDYDAAVFMNGQRIEGKAESWGGSIALKSLFQQAQDYAAQPHADLHLNAGKYANAANFVVTQDPNFTTIMWDAINEKNLEVIIEGVTQKAKLAAPTLDLRGDEITELAYEIFVRIVQDIPIVDEIKVPFASEVKNRLLSTAV